MTTISTVAVHGLTGHPLTLTAAAVDGPPGITLVTGHQSANRELHDRVHAALANSRPRHGDPRPHVEVRIPPASAQPEAAAVAVAVLAATLDVVPQRLASTAVLGEVGLDGSLRPTLGVLPAAQAAYAHGIRRVIVPAASLGQAALVDGLDVLGAHTLAEIADWLRGDDAALHRLSVPAGPVAARQPAPMSALTATAQRVVTIAAAGGHHLLCGFGTDAGTAAVASWLHALVPDLTPQQQLELAAIQSLLGPREDGAALVSTPPLVVTHHSDPIASLLGGPQPGLLSQAHHGVLFAPELDEFGAAAQEALRGVLIEREVRLSHDGRTHRFPSGLQLIATSIRTSAPRRWQMAPALRDAIDIQTIARHTALHPKPDAHDHARVTRLLKRARADVATARARAAARWSRAGQGPGVTNASVPHAVLHAVAGTAAVADRVRHAQDTGALSGRGADIALRLAWTVADLDGADEPGRHHIEQALALRNAVDIGPTEAEVR
ncbi:ATP-binding protein [Amycolatopsis sp. cg9]|uniref:ATP-binding protein n=1 Tax=Amycolatopsis sp. cg9 TaxID=3238801 RepID=UPI003524F98C